MNVAIEKKVGLLYKRSTMIIWLLPKVMNLVDQDQASSLNAIFQLLQHIPDLCNVNSREGIRQNQA